MRKNRAVLTAILLAVTSPALGQAPAQSGIETYPPSFFTSSRPTTAMDMIGRLPGFTFDGGDQSRGFSGNAGNVLIDGQRPSSKSDYLGNILGRIPASDVDHIEVINGGAPGIDMQGRPVIANVVLKKTDSSSLVVVVQSNLQHDGRTAQGGRVEYSHRSGDQTYEASVRRDGYGTDSPGLGYRDDFDATNTRTRTDVQRQGNGGNLTFNGSVKSPLAGGDFGANLTLQQSYNNNSSLYNFSAAPEFFNGNNRDRSGEVGANYQHRIGSATLDIILLQRLGHSAFVSNSADLSQTAQYTSTNDTGESIGRFALRYPLTDTLSVESGAEGAYNFLEGASAFSQNGVPVVLPSSHVMVDETRTEAFGQIAWQMRPDLTLETGLRAEYSVISETGDIDKSRSFFYLKPRAFLTWILDAASQIRLRVEHKLGQLNFYDFVSSANLTTSVISAGNPDVRPDQRWQYELGYDYHFWGKGAFTVTLLHQDISNILDSKPFTSSGTTFDVRGNIGDGRADEVGFNLTVPLDKIGIDNGLLSSSVTLRNSAVRDPVTGQMRRISGEDASSISVNFSQDLPGLKSSWGLNFFNGWQDNYYQFAELDHYARTPSVGFNWTYNASDDLKLNFSANSIFGYRNDSVRTLYSGARGSSPVSGRQDEISLGRPSFFFAIRKTFN